MIDWDAVEQRHDGIERCDSCGSLVYSDTNACPTCAGEIAETPHPLDIGSRLEIERAVDAFVMDLRTMAFYTDFLFTKESKLFRYNLMREPL